MNLICVASLGLAWFALQEDGAEGYIMWMCPSISWDEFLAFHVGKSSAHERSREDSGVVKSYFLFPPSPIALQGTFENGPTDIGDTSTIYATSRRFGWCGSFSKRFTWANHSASISPPIMTQITVFISLQVRPKIASARLAPFPDHHLLKLAWASIAIRFFSRAWPS